jgi:hypothetical protein
MFIGSNNVDIQCFVGFCCIAYESISFLYCRIRTVALYSEKAKNECRNACLQNKTATYSIHRLGSRFLSLGYACELLLGEICYRAFPSMYIHPLRRNTDQQVKVQISRVSQAFHVVRPLQSLGLRVQTFLEFGGLLCEALVARLDRFVQTEDVAPVIFGARIMALLDGTVKCKIKAADLAEVVSLQVGGDAGHRRSLVGIVHLIEVFDRVFHHPRFLGQDIPQEFFHDLDLVITTFLWQSILKGGDEFHGKVSIFRLDA